ncbi:DUF4258 domain-containing protein [Castellaniella hirudinis]|uniref:DUF4258 domain-containing protein n=1 Tax=Castellaniella hirudinis TaxID=1144617 RepID=A0ABV8RWM6_9BURK
MVWNKRDWEKRIRDLARDPSCIVWTKHAGRQMRQRHISLPTVLEVLRRGTLWREPETDIRTGHVVCRMEYFCAGMEIGVCVALQSAAAPGMAVVTVMVIGR